MVSIYSSEGKSLPILSALVDPLVGPEYSVVCVIMSHINSVLLAVGLKSLLSQDCLISCCALLKADVSQTGKLIHIDRGILVSFRCELSGKLSNKSWCW